MADFDLARLKSISSSNSRYELQLQRLQRSGAETKFIESAVAGALDNISEAKSQSFVVYGDPQSRKTEMMICLTAKLLDVGNRLVVHLLNDSVQLLGQNLGRFQRSGLAPAAKNFSEILDPELNLKKGEWVIFCKKNANDLGKLLDKTASISGKIIIDDEADFATPNAKINAGEITRVNALIGELLFKGGTYIGVTPTPARLDLNNTFDNDNERWIRFHPHSLYGGQDVFFPIDRKVAYRLELLPDDGDAPRFAQEALYRFMISAAYLNTYENNEEKNYSMLVHTSGRRDDHKVDRKTLEKVFESLQDSASSEYSRTMQKLAKKAIKLFPQANLQELLEYVARNASRNTIVVMNSERDKNIDLRMARNPATPFTLVVGGNIVLRGVTFENLLSMFFTRNAKGKLQQDTYIQRARMFGNRGGYLPFFELAIPELLYLDWHRCFVFHKLAIAAIEAGDGSPVWLADSRISVASDASIDKARVQFDRGEMSFGMFDYDPSVEKAVTGTNAMKDLERLQNRIGTTALPEYLLRYVARVLPNGPASVALHPFATIAGRKDDTIDQNRIERTKGFMGASELQRGKYPKAIHHFKVFYNSKGKARLFYKFDGSLQFIKNLRNDG